MQFLTSPARKSMGPFFSALALSGLLFGCTSSPKTSVTLNYYQIGGDSLHQIDKDIKKHGPRINGNQRAVAVSNIKMIPDISLSNRENGCAVNRARIKVIAKVTLPRWINRKGAKRELAQSWDNLDHYTRLHESVHIAIADRFARLLESQLLTMKPLKSCAITKKTAQSIIVATMKKHDREQQKFDIAEKRKFAKLARHNKS